MCGQMGRDHTSGGRSIGQSNGWACRRAVWQADIWVIVRVDAWLERWAGGQMGWQVFSLHVPDYGLGQY